MCLLVCLFVFLILQGMWFCNANNLESSSSSLTLIIASRKNFRKLSSWEDRRKFSASYWKFPQHGLRGLGTVHLLHEVSGSPHAAATWEAPGWQQVDVVSFQMPVPCAQPIEGESWSSLQSKAVSQRDQHSLLLEKAKGVFPVERSWLNMKFLG